MTFILRDIIGPKGFTLRGQRTRMPLLTGEVIGEIRTRVRQRLPFVTSLWTGAPVIEAIDKRLSRKFFDSTV